MAKGWRETKKARTAEKLFKTALDLFRKRGYESVSVREITEAAQVAKGTFFNYFPSKDHLLVTWYANCASQAMAQCQGADFANAQEAIITLVLSEIEFAMEERHLLAAKHQISLQGSMVAQVEQEGDEELFTYCRRYLEKDQKAGMFVPHLDLDHFAELIITVLTGIARRWVYQGGDFDMKTVVERDFQFLFDAIRAVR